MPNPYTPNSYTANPYTANRHNQDLALGRLIHDGKWREYFTSKSVLPKHLYRVSSKTRTGHMYILGRTGVGKSTCIVDLMLQDIVANRGCGVIDPHSDLVYGVLSLMKHRGLLADPHYQSRIVYVNPREDRYAPAFNVLALPETASDRDVYILTREIIEAFKRAWASSLAEAPQFTGIMLFSLPVLIRAKLTLIHLDRFLLDEAFRSDLLERFGDEDERRFFEMRVQAWGRREMVLRMESTNNKLAPLTRDPDLKRMLGAEENTIHFRKLMDESKIFLADVGGCDHLLPSLMTTFFQLAAMSRIDLAPEERRPFYLFIDEFHDFSVGEGSEKTFSKILSGARKYGLHLHLAHQHLDQLTPTMKKSIFANTWTKLIFSVSEYDAHDLATVVGLGYFDTQAVKEAAKTESQHPSWKPLNEQHTELAALLASQRQARAIVRNNLGEKVDIYTNPVEQVSRIDRDDLLACLEGYTLKAVHEVYIAEPKRAWESESDDYLVP